MSIALLVLDKTLTLIAISRLKFNPVLTVFQMIPETGSKLEDVMSTFREADPKYQDSNVSCLWL